MQGNTRIIALLNALLAGELAARDQYFLHSRMLSEWGLHRLAERIGHEMEDETGHADVLIRRILFLEGIPQMTPAALRIGHDVTSMLQNDLAVELEVVAELRRVIGACEQEGDYVTRDLLLPLLDDTEHDHARWLEQQLRLIKLMGLPNYIQSQASGSNA